jgi:hypothetical protein
MAIRYSMLLVLACLAGSAGVAHAKGRLVSVIPTDGGCPLAPGDPSDPFWNVEADKTYECWIDRVTDCANEGEDPTIKIRVNATGPGFMDVTADRQAKGVYKFTLKIPSNNPSCTLPIHYCTPPGSTDPGLRVLRDDDEQHPAHLRIVTYGPSCSNPSFPNCETTSVRSRTWAQVKQIYR